jgi:hypothetical protein
MMQSICILVRQFRAKIAAHLDRCVNLETETIRVSDELLDLAVVSGAAGEVLCNSWVLQEAMTWASQSVLGFAQ